MPKATIIPDPDLYARPLGKFEWTCPNCGQEHPFTHFPWRHSNTSCSRCYARFRLGVGLSITQSHDAFIMGKFNCFTVNRLNPQGTRFDGAKLHGAIEWQCPVCSAAQSAFANYDGCIECTNCIKPFWLSLLIWRSTMDKTALKTPLDVIVRGLNVSKTPEPISAETAGSQ